MTLLRNRSKLYASGAPITHMLNDAANAGSSMSLFSVLRDFPGGVHFSVSMSLFVIDLAAQSGVFACFLFLLTCFPGVDLSFWNI